MTAVELHDVHKAYGATQVVKGLSLTINPGEFLSLLGPSGCGKTTTLRMIAGLEHVDRGEIRIDGATVDGPNGPLAPERRQLAMVFQSYAIWPHKSVAENVAYPLLLQRIGRDDRQRRVREALSWVRLTTLHDRMPTQLSGGQLQRVALARALVANPKVLLFDEPLSNLDAALREELRGEIAALRTRLGTTMIFVTHDQHEALALSDRIAVMLNGRIEQLATPQLLYGAPSTAFVAGFVGAANLIEGTLREGQLEAHGLRFPCPDASHSGSVTVAVRAEAVSLGEPGGVPLRLVAALFLGHAMEYRLELGDRTLRAVGPPLQLTVGSMVPVRFRKVTVFPR